MNLTHLEWFESQAFSFNHPAITTKIPEWRNKKGQKHVENSDTVLRCDKEGKQRREETTLFS